MVQFSQQVMHNDRSRSSKDGNDICIESCCLVESYEYWLLIQTTEALYFLHWAGVAKEF